MLSSIIEDYKYLQLKRGYKQKIEKLEEQLSKNNTPDWSEQNILRKLNKALDIVQNISRLYIDEDIEKKRTLIGSIFPKKK